MVNICYEIRGFYPYYKLKENEHKLYEKCDQDIRTIVYNIVELIRKFIAKVVKQCYPS